MMKFLLALLFMVPVNASAFFGLGRMVWMTSSSTSTVPATAFSATCTGSCTESDDGLYHVLTFTAGTSSVTFSASGVLSEILLVGQGGGAGGGANGAGGGAGGMVEIGTRAVNGTTYTVIVGSTGGLGGGTDNGNPGQVGSNTSFDSIVALGGGGGGSYDSVSCSNGGSGGGGASNSGVGCSSTQDVNTGGGFGYGYSGGIAGSAYSSGGGGAGGNGEGGNTGNPAYGGIGRDNDITGSSVTYAKGGTYDVGTYGCDTTTNTGNGGPGGVNYNCPGIPGIVVIRYLR